MGAVASAGAKVSDAVKSLDDKDKKTLDEHIHAVTPEGLKDAAQKKAGEVLGTASKIINSPEAKIAGKLAGDDVDGKLKSAGKLVDDISKNPLIVGDQKKEENQKSLG